MLIFVFKASTKEKGMPHQSTLNDRILKVVHHINNQLLHKEIGALEILQESIHHIVEISGCQYGFIGTLDDQDGMINYQHLLEYKVSKKEFNPFDKALLKSPLNINQVSKAHHFLKYIKSINSATSYYDEERANKNLPWYTHLLIPLQKNGKTIAILGLCDRKNGFGQHYALRLKPICDTLLLVLQKYASQFNVTSFEYNAPLEQSSFEETFDLMVHTNNLWEISKRNYSWIQKFGGNKTHITDFVFGDEVPQLQELFLKAKSECITQTGTFRFKKDKKRIYTLSIKVIYQSATNTYHIIGKDISDRFRQESILKKQKDRLRHTQFLLQKSNNELDALIYHISHDLRSPLATALGLIQVGLLENNIEVLKEELKLQQKSLEKMDYFISEILEFAQITRSPNSNVEINVETIISELINKMNQNGKSNLELDIVVNNYVPFKSDLQKVTVILQNIIQNAFQFINKYNTKNLLKISVNIEENDTCIVFEDNGIGIPSQYINRVTEMFFRAHEDKVGSGIGLYVVDQAVKRLRGFLKILSEVNKGTSVIIWLPNHYFIKH